MTPANILGLDESHLVPCQAGHKLTHQVCQAFLAMQQAAKQDGIDLQIVSSYRSFARQKLIWEKKWSGQSILLDNQEIPLDFATLSDQQKLFAILTWSALPGASRHHWGTDLDVYDKQSVEQANHSFQLVCSEYDQGPCRKLNHWLAKHAEQFGFYRPYANYTGGIAREPWHLSHQASAEPIINQLNQQMLIKQLTQSNILGIDSILEHMPTIYPRFILNKG